MNLSLISKSQMNDRNGTKKKGEDIINVML